jgi:hypothetical protein
MEVLSLPTAKYVVLNSISRRTAQSQVTQERNPCLFHLQPDTQTL